MEKSKYVISLGYMLPSFCMPLIHELEESCEKVSSFEDLPQ